MIETVWHVFALWHPELIVLIVLLAFLYFYATTRLRQGTESESTSYGNARIAFISFLVVLYVALGSPVAFLAQNRFFYVFVIQSLLINLMMPWLLLVSIPSWMYTAMFRVHWLYRTFRALTQPVVALILYNVLATLFLIPSIFEANLRYNGLHIIDQSVLMVAAILLWWPLVSPSVELPRLGRGWQLLYILFGTNFMMPVPVVLLMVHNPWYSTYLKAAGTSNSLTVLADQQLGAIIMIVGMIVIYGIRAVATYASYDGQKWYE